MSCRIRLLYSNHMTEHMTYGRLGGEYARALLVVVEVIIIPRHSDLFHCLYPSMGGAKPFLSVCFSF